MKYRIDYGGASGSIPDGTFWLHSDLYNIIIHRLWHYAFMLYCIFSHGFQ